MCISNITYEYMPHNSIHIYYIDCGGSDAFKCNMSVCQHCSRNGNANKLCATDTNQSSSFHSHCLSLFHPALCTCPSVTWFL